MNPSAAREPAIGYVVIGRNEGARLTDCLQSIPGERTLTVYVDSGSSDDSVMRARRAGVIVHELDPARPFSAARARNEGFAALMRSHPSLDAVMFIDGDCTLDAAFPATARAILGADARIAIVAGRCREARREATLYNRLCDFEWDRPTGDVDACGGIFLTRTTAFERSGGFNAAVVAGEEEEMCLRLRQAGWIIRRIADDMCRHDANMTTFGQWWRRNFRAGHSYAQVARLHRGHYRAERLRALGWGVGLPAVIAACVLAFGAVGLGLLALYPASFHRTSQALVRQGFTPADARLYAAFLVLAKFPNAAGMIEFQRRELLSHRIEIIEYKGPQGRRAGGGASPPTG